MARDIGEILGCGAHLTKLVRTKVGAFELKDAVSPEAFQANLED
jgi:tRNA pseudouridine55 synthase